MFQDTWQHVTMYGFFLLSGVVDIVSQVCQTAEHEAGSGGGGTGLLRAGAADDKPH